MADNQYNCPTCDGNFKSKEELDIHVRQAHKNEEQPEEHSITCSKCGFRAKSSEEMGGHTRRHIM